MRVVVDASVAIKWILPDPDHEADLDAALEILEGARSGELEPIQPPHWLAEVAAVVTLVRPSIVERSIRLLDAMELTVDTEIDTLVLAGHLATDLEHHLFDTLYHAVALTHDATLITADTRYIAKARHLGAIRALQRY